MAYEIGRKKKGNFSDNDRMVFCVFFHFISFFFFVAVFDQITYSCAGFLHVIKSLKPSFLFRNVSTLDVGRPVAHSGVL